MERTPVTIDDQELDHLRAMHHIAVKLAASSDPLLRGQYEALLGRITALLTIKSGLLPADATLLPDRSDRS